MKTKQIVTVIACSFSFLSALCQDITLHFVNMPFVEGNLFVAVTIDGKPAVAQMAEVTDTVVDIPMTVDVADGDTIHVQAFQDLNDNRNLDFDSYGRPDEPCLSQPIVVSLDVTVELKQYK